MIEEKNCKIYNVLLLIQPNISLHKHSSKLPLNILGQGIALNTFSFLLIVLDQFIL